MPTFDNRREDPSAHESTNFPDGSSGAIELATYSSGTGFTSKKTKAVARTELAKAQEDAVDHLGTDVRVALVMLFGSRHTANAPTFEDSWL